VSPASWTRAADAQPSDNSLQFRHPLPISWIGRARARHSFVAEPTELSATPRAPGRHDACPAERRMPNPAARPAPLTRPPTPEPPVRASRRTRTARPRPVPAAFFRDVVGSLRNGAIVITRAGVLAHMNREAYRILGLVPGPGDVGGRYVDALRAFPEIIRILRSAFETSDPPNRAELRLRGTGRVIGYTVGAVRDTAGQVTGATLLFKDLTRVEQIEERERLRDRLAALGEMAAAIAHEVKNPLAGIKVIAGLLKRRVAGDGDAESLIGDIIGEANMADAIVVEILDFVRPIRLQVEPVSLARVIEEAVHVAESRGGRRGTVVRVDVPPDIPTLESDAIQLRQLFTNLVTNAFEAVDGEGEVSIAVRLQAVEVESDAFDFHCAPQRAIVTVSDTGGGVPEDLRDRIFSPFFTTKARGSGLGLAIVRKIVDAHDGRIDVLPNEGGGACFRVTLPVAVAPENTLLSIADAPAMAGLRPATPRSKDLHPWVAS
jgi:signal transduction histidine kinase